MSQHPHVAQALAAAAIALAGPVHALVPVTPADIVGTGVMSASCASLHGSGNGLTIGGAIDDGLFADATSCTGQAVAGAAGTANSTASWSNAKAAATTRGKASMGSLHLSSQLDTPGGLDAANFPLATTQSGFGDTMTFHLSGHEGEAGVVHVALHVSGVLDASGNSGSAGFVVGFTKNDSEVFNDYGASQSHRWTAASYPVPGPLTEHVVVDEMVSFTIPIVFGTSFEMVVLGQSLAGTRSQDGGGHSASDFAHTVWWAGVQGVTVGGKAVDGYTLDSGSGIDWTRAVAVPEPSSWLLLVAGLGLVAGVRPTARKRPAA